MKLGTKGLAAVSAPDAEKRVVAIFNKGEPWRKGILGLATDLRLQRRRPSLGTGGMNLFVAGTIEAAGRVCWSEEEVLVGLGAWKRELASGPQPGT